MPKKKKKPSRVDASPGTVGGTPSPGGAPSSASRSSGADPLATILGGGRRGGRARARGGRTGGKASPGGRTPGGAATAAKGGSGKGSAKRGGASRSLLRELARESAETGVRLSDLNAPRYERVGAGRGMEAVAVNAALTLHVRAVTSEGEDRPFTLRGAADSVVLMSLLDMEARGLCADDEVIVSVAEEESAAGGSKFVVVGVGSVWPAKRRMPGEIQVGRALFARVESSLPGVADVGGVPVRVSALDVVPVVAQEIAIWPERLESSATSEVDISTNEIQSMVTLAIVGSTLLDGSKVNVKVAALTRPFTVSCVVPRLHGSHDGLSTFTVTRSTRVVLKKSPFHRSTGKVAEDDTDSARVTGFAAVGGLATQVAAVRQLVEVPLNDPGLFQSFGLPSSRGVLLYGPPGTGKTLIARSVAQATRCAFLPVNGPELISKFVGETERKLRDLFDRAVRMAPTVVFLDEVDSLCPSRERASFGAAVSELQSRIISTLLDCVDGIPAGSQVVVLAATNRPASVDGGLTRPGRLDRELEIGIPSEPARHDILQVQLRQYPHELSDKFTAHVAQVTNGYVGADLRALVQESALAALKRHVHADAAAGSPLTITQADMRRGLQLCGPSALREVRVDVPRVRWTDIGGQEAIKASLQEAVEWPLKYATAFTEMGIRPPKGVLLYGPPGCSKTMMAKALATEGSMNFIAVKGPELFSKWVGESEQAVAEVFRKARAAAPTVVFFDEIDALASSRGADSGSSVNARVLSQLLHEMDGIEPLKQVVVVAATNRPDLLDAALLRPGRLDRLLYVGPPDKASRKAIVQLCLDKTPHSGDGLDADHLAALTEGLSGAEVVSIFREAALGAMNEDVNARHIEARHINLALSRIEPQITAKMLEFYARFSEGSAGGL